MARGVRQGFSTLTFVFLLVGGFFLFSSSQESGLGKPELHPTTLSLDPSSPVEQGRLINVLAKLENSGESAAPEFKVEFFVRRRPAGGDVPSWTSFSVTQLRGLSPQEQEISVQAVLDTSKPELIPTPDIYEIRVVVDSNNQIPELDETNNELIVSLLVLPSKLGKPDVRPVALTFTPPSPIVKDPTAQNQTVLATATIINSGDRDAGPFQVRFAHCRISEGQTSCPAEFIGFDDNRPSAFIGGLPKGGSKDDGARLAISPLDPGIYLIKVTVDPPDPDNPAGQIQEQDEANNDLIAVLSIQGPELHPTSIRFNPPLPRVGDTVKTIATIKNSGQGTARNVEVAFFVDGAPFDRKILTLEEGQEAPVEGFLKTADLQLEVGIHVIRVVVDLNNQISERDETNNEIRTALTLQPPIPRRPELHPKSLIVNPRSPIELDGNRELTILSEIVNTGEVDALNFEIAFSYRLIGSVRWIPLPCTTNCAVAGLTGGTAVIAEGKLPLGALTPGNYEIRVVVDPTDRVLELDDSNNEMRSAFMLLRARKPDLIIEPTSVRFEPSAQVRRGTSVIISAAVVNIGERAAGPFTVEYSLRHLEEEIFNPFARQPVNGLAVGEQIVLKVALDTTSLRPGLYELQIVADPDRGIEELDEENNVFFSGPDPQTALFVRGPDLAPVGFRFADPALSTSPRVARGTPVEVIAEITNIGPEATGAFAVEFCRQRVEEASCIPFGERASFPGLGSGVVVQVQATLDTAALAPGSYLIQVVADPVEQGRPFGQVEEENELNNRAILPLEILGPGGPPPPPGAAADLTVLSLTLDPEVVQFGDKVKVTARVANIGRVGAGPFRVDFLWKRGSREEKFAEHAVSGLAPDASQLLTAELDTRKLPFPSGRFLIIVVVDSDNAVKELNENNNSRTEELLVQ